MRNGLQKFPRKFQVILKRLYIYKMNSQERAREIINIFKKLQEKNLGITEFEEFKKFRGICNEFIRNGMYTQGEIKVLGTKRIILYSFTDTVDCMLKYDENV